MSRKELFNNGSFQVDVLNDGLPLTRGNLDFGFGDEYGFELEDLVCFLKFLVNTTDVLDDYQVVGACRPAALTR